MARPKREDLRLERRQAILDAAMKVFAQRGYAAATIRAIAREANIAQGTIYLYFPSKRDILLALYRSMILESLEEIMARPEKGDDEAFLRSLVVDRILRFRQNAQAVRFAFTELPFHDELREKFYREIALEQLGRIQAFLKDRIAHGKFRPLRAEIAARAFQGMYVIFALAEVVYDDPEVARFTPEEIADEVVRLFLRGARSQD
ncbi:MAG: TetR/AcrR family transcriptional regulator [candidate division NC10 bacterium]|nr:TetR/AcrR family transcriptional regulator [candidate division NC10 bacterium]MBI2455237.1 TetR/AcrR family transcriptional regulator [candidate division NC10 bacterium]